MPEMDWLKCFMKRHPNLAIKLAENTKRTILELLRREDQSTLTGFTVHASESNTTIMFAISASGDVLPAYVVPIQGDTCVKGGLKVG
ncbi:hypothetical protein NQ315_014086 [Exocentrus adspersus]|uniref:Uncharacterized protein n=1 Tax=Exocentrus adspersus TaxID=1586481 RepID=A0AAV8VWD8_9CUCU|nr:hypothetical protein NQ315_014086 [Exocentrus adspersus]